MAKQSSKEEQHIHVSVRIRPNNPSEYETKSFLEVLSKKEILSKTTYNQKRYVFDRVFDSHSSQQEVYTSIVSPLIPEVIGGYNCTVFAYGQTGTGKTYTMEGVHDKDNQISSGIIPRALSQIFKVLGNMHTESSIKVSYLELYNEELFDLLSQSTAPKAIKIYEDKAQKGSIIFQGLEELSVTELNQVYKILEQGAEKRRIASTLMNNTSSRSHTVFTIVVHTREITVEGEELVKTGKLNLVDLAGSENISKSGAIEKRAREAGNINQSLLTLGRVIKALTEKNTHVPYRESKLTRILQDSLGGRTKTSLIATISSENIHIEETLNTLEYAMRARCIQNRPELNQKISRTALINQYSDTIEKLQRDLIAMRTGTGVYVDEDNYTKLLSDHEAQKVEITAKMGYIKKLEGEIADYTDKLHILQASWTEAANNIEYLSNEKKILEKDLIIVKEVNEQQQRELDEYRHKHQHLKDETEKLLSDVQKHSANEDALHKKVSFLYQTSQNNKLVAKAFYNMYSKSYRELISGVEKCVNFTLKSITSMDAFLQDESKEMVYRNIATEVNSLLNISKDLRDYKSKYFENKNNLRTRFNSYFNSLQSLLDCVHERSVSFSYKFDESLTYLRSTINSFSDEQDVDLKIVLSSLFNIREAVDNEYLTMTNSLSEFHSNVFDKIDDLIAENEYLKEEHTENQKLIITLREKLNDRYDTLLKDISEMKKTSIAELSNCELRQQMAVAKCSSLTDRMELFKQSIGDTAATCKETFDTLNSRKLVQDSIVSLNKINDKAQLKKKIIVESMDERINDANLVKTNINSCTEELQTDLSNARCEMDSIESFDDAHYDTLDKLITEMCDITKGIETSSQMIFIGQDELKNKIQHTHEEAVDALRNTLTFCNTQSKDLEVLVDEFCGCKLQYPTHVGDTPQKVQPKSSLYIQTLSRNCFNGADGGKDSRFLQNVNKENLSNALNIMCPKENNVDI